MGDDAPVAAFLVTREGLAEVHDIVEPGEQNVPQRDAAHRAMLADRIGLLRRHQLALEGEQHPHVLGHETECPTGLAAGAVEQLEQVRRQAGVQGAAA